MGHRFRTIVVLNCIFVLMNLLFTFKLYLQIRSHKVLEYKRGVFLSAGRSLTSSSVSVLFRGFFRRNVGCGVGRTDVLRIDFTFIGLWCARPPSTFLLLAAEASHSKVLQSNQVYCEGIYSGFILWWLEPGNCSHVAKVFTVTETGGRLFRFTEVDDAVGGARN